MSEEKTQGDKPWWEFFIAPIRPYWQGALASILAILAVLGILGVAGKLSEKPSEGVESDPMGQHSSAGETRSESLTERSRRIAELHAALKGREGATKPPEPPPKPSPCPEGMLELRDPDMHLYGCRQPPKY